MYGIGCSSLDTEAYALAYALACSTLFYAKANSERGIYGIYEMFSLISLISKTFSSVLYEMVSLLSLLDFHNLSWG